MDFLTLMWTRFNELLNNVSLLQIITLFLIWDVLKEVAQIKRAVARLGGGE